MSKSKFLIGLTGSIACYKTCHVISQLRQLGHEVQVIVTPSALEFVGPATLEGLSGRAVLSDTFTPGHMMDHIALARWADAFLIAPLTAHHANMLALGLAGDLLSSLYLAYEIDKPLYLAPAMNTVMYSHPTVQNSIEALRSRGAQILTPGSGPLACGEDGPGRMMEPDHILQKIFNAKKNDRAKVLITFGGTRETIDGVRTLTNTSTGETGARLATALVESGFDVTLLSSLYAKKVPNSLVQDQHAFVSHADLDDKIKHLLSSQHFDAVIHAAAVSDFYVDQIIGDSFQISPSADVKLDSQKSLTMQLKTTKKIVNHLKNYSRNPNLTVIAFKLTHTRDKTEQYNAVKKLLSSGGIDHVVHNDLHEVGLDRSLHPFTLYSQKVEPKTAHNVFQLQELLLPVLDASKTKSQSKIPFEVKHDFMS